MACMCMPHSSVLITRPTKVSRHKSFEGIVKSKDGERERTL